MGLVTGFLEIERKERPYEKVGGLSDSALDDPGRPRQRAHDVEDNGMGDMLRFDAERLRILIERHHLHTGSARARELLENWDDALKSFVKVMPKDYKRVLSALKKANESGLSGDDAITAAFEENARDVARIGGG